MKKLLTVMTLGVTMISSDISWAVSTATGSQGQSISVKSAAAKSGQEIRITGRGFDETIGI